jgi:hypothetical protein
LSFHYIVVPALILTPMPDDEASPTLSLRFRCQSRGVVEVKSNKVPQFLTDGAHWATDLKDRLFVRVYCRARLEGSRPARQADVALLTPELKTTTDKPGDLA